MARCWHASGNSGCLGDATWDERVNKAFCVKHADTGDRLLAMAAHPASLPPLNLAPLDPRRCYFHNRPDKWTCQECIDRVDVG